MNKFREKLASGERLFGTHINLTDHRIAEMVGNIGFDYIWFDMEHISTSFAQMEMHLIGARASGTPSLVRICWNDIPHAKRVLEAGPDAVLFPQINSIEEAQHAIDTCIYPPEGKRGFGPFRAVRYGLDSTDAYIHGENEEMLRFLQIESKNAVECMDEMCRIPYVDGFVIGPMDLSGSLGKLGMTRDPQVDELIEKAITTARSNGKYIGLSTGVDTPEELRYWIQRDLDFLSSGTDSWNVIKGASALLSSMREISADIPRTRS